MACNSDRSLQDRGLTTYLYEAFEEEDENEAPGGSNKQPKSLVEIGG
jgi:hypothetical protein